MCKGIKTAAGIRLLHTQIKIYSCKETAFPLPVAKSNGQRSSYYQNNLGFAWTFSSIVLHLVTSDPIFSLLGCLCLCCVHISLKLHQSSFGTFWWVLVRLFGVHRVLMAAFTVIQINRTKRAITPEFIFVESNRPNVSTL